MSSECKECKQLEKFCKKCETCYQIKQKLLTIVREIYLNASKSGNNSIIKRIDTFQEKIERAISDLPNVDLLIETNPEALENKLKTLLEFSQNKNMMGSINVFRYMWASQQLKKQNWFMASLESFPQFITRLIQTSITKSQQFGFQSTDVEQRMANFNFFCESQAVQDEDLTMFLSLVFTDLDNEDINYTNKLNANKFIQKMKVLTKHEFFKELNDIFSIAVIRQNPRKVIVKTLANPIEYSPVLAKSERKNSAIYLQNDMVLKLSPNYKIRVIEVYPKKSKELLLDSFSAMEIKQQLEISTVMKNPRKYIILEEIVDIHKFPHFTLFVSDGLIQLNHFLDIPQKVVLNLIVDQNGCYFSVEDEYPGFYPSIQFDRELISTPKEINISLVFNNELRVHIDSDGGELFFDEEKYRNNLVSL